VERQRDWDRRFPADCSLNRGLKELTDAGATRGRGAKRTMGVYYEGSVNLTLRPPRS
jgi:hypothetical protein